MNCCYGILRVLLEIWILLVKMIEAMGLVLAVFQPQNVKLCVVWIKSGLKEENGRLKKFIKQYKDYRHSQKVITFIAVVVLVVIYGIISLVVSVQGEDPKQQYLAAAKWALFDCAENIQAEILDLRETRALTNEKKEYLFQLLEQQKEADRLMLEFDMSKLEDYQDLHRGVCALCEDDIYFLERIWECIKEGRMPSWELQKDYTSLRGEKYLWVLTGLYEEFVGFAIIEEAY